MRMKEFQFYIGQWGLYGSGVSAQILVICFFTTRLEAVSVLCWSGSQPMTENVYINSARSSTTTAPSTS